MHFLQHILVSKNEEKRSSKNPNAIYDTRAEWALFFLWTGICCAGAFLAAGIEEWHGLGEINCGPTPLHLDGYLQLGGKLTGPTSLQSEI